MPAGEVKKMNFPRLANLVVIHVRVTNKIDDVPYL